MTNKEKFLQLANKMQDDALKKTDIDLFRGISKLTDIMFEVSYDGYCKGSKEAVAIFTKK